VGFLTAEARSTLRRELTAKFTKKDTKGSDNYFLKLRDLGGKRLFLCELRVSVVNIF
jgi:hypothetical protein